MRILAIDTSLPAVSACVLDDDAETPIASETIEMERKRMGLDRPLLIQFKDWMVGLATLDLGKSMWTDRPVVEEIAIRLELSLQVAIMATAVALATLYVMIEAIPAGNKTFIRVTGQLLVQKAASEVKPGVFYQGFPGKVIYVSAARPDGMWEKVLLATTSNAGLPTLVLADEGRQRRVAARHDDGGVHDVDHVQQPLAARLALRRDGGAVIRRAAAHHVGDEELLVPPPHCLVVEGGGGLLRPAVLVEVLVHPADRGVRVARGDDLVEEHARGPDERDQRLVLLLARPLADDHDVGVGVARGEHQLVPHLLAAAAAAPRPRRPHLPEGALGAAVPARVQGLELVLLAALVLGKRGGLLALLLVFTHLPPPSATAVP